MSSRPQTSLLLAATYGEVEPSGPVCHRLKDRQRIQVRPQQNVERLDRLLHGLIVRQAAWPHLLQPLEPGWPHLVCTWYVPRRCDASVLSPAD